MKKFSVIIGLGLFAAACGPGSNQDKTISADSLASVNQSAVNRQSDVDTSRNDIGTSNTTAGTSKGARLIASSDCLTCHKEHEKLIGPSYADVAKKYKPTDGNINKLVTKVMKGGQGSWGDIPMPAHPGLSEADIKIMVTYILALK